MISIGGPGIARVLDLSVLCHIFTGPELQDDSLVADVELPEYPPSELYLYRIQTERVGLCVALHTHRERKLASLAQSRSRSMSKTNRQEIESVAIHQISFVPTATAVVNGCGLQDDRRDLCQVCGTVVCPLKHLACPMTASLQVFQALNIKLIVHQPTRG